MNPASKSRTEQKWNGGRRTLLIAAAGIVLLTGIGASSAEAQQPEFSPDDAVQALNKAVGFFRNDIAVGGGYVWRYTGDVTQRDGEGNAGRTRTWIQPPGTPSVGEALLEAYEATGEQICFEAAREAAYSLVNGQLRSGGWYYYTEFDPDEREKFPYRARGGEYRQPPQDESNHSERAWSVWKDRGNGRNVTTLDDDTTQSAIRFLVRFDGATNFQDETVHEAAEYALNSLLRVQYPNGGWSHWYDRYPVNSPDAELYPVVSASYPESWQRTWPDDYTGCYVFNDNLVADAIETLYLAADVYDEPRYREAAERAGEYILLAQMPDAQPAWAQQYDRHMHPVWARKFEPPSISGSESQRILGTLMELYRRTGEKKYLEPIPKAIDYFRKSTVEAGRLARFYELRTNRPLYFVRGTYELTYSPDNLPTHYGFIVSARMDRLEREYRRALERGPQRRRSNESESRPERRPSPQALARLAGRAQSVAEQMDERGAWVEAGRMRGEESDSESGVITTRTFIRHLDDLAEYIEAAGRAQ